MIIFGHAAINSFTVDKKLIAIILYEYIQVVILRQKHTALYFQNVARKSYACLQKTLTKLQQQLTVSRKR